MNRRVSNRGSPAVCSLRGQGERRNRIRVPRLWDQRSHSDDPLRSAETAPLPGRRRDHLAVLTIDGLLQWNRYKAGLRSNHPHIAHGSSRYRPMPVTLVARRFRDVPFRVAQSTTCTGRRVHRPYPLRRPVRLVLNPAMESVLPAEPEPIQQMSEDALHSAPIQSSFGAATHPEFGGGVANAIEVVEECNPRVGERKVSGRDESPASISERSFHGRAALHGALRSGGRLPGQPFEFRNQMLECFEIADCCH